MDTIRMLRIGVIIGVLIICSYQDIREKKIPVYLIALGAAAVLILNIIARDMEPVNIVLGAITGIVLIIISRLTNGAIGMGDALLTIMIGISCGAFQTMLVLFYALVITSVVSVVLLLLKRVKRKTQIPFVPFMLIGYLGVVMVW